MTTTLLNSEGYTHNYTNEQLELILVGLSSSNTYYTNGKNDIIFVKLDTSRLLLLDFTYHINRNIFQNYTIQHDSVKPYNLEFVLNGSSNEYDLQSVYNGSGFIGIITELTQVYLNIYDNGTATSSNDYTGSENIVIDDRVISLTDDIIINSIKVKNDDDSLTTMINLNAYGGLLLDIFWNNRGCF